jgi:hypothetical protein
MSCDRVQALLGVPAELDRAERLLLTRHLRDCPDCRTAQIDEERVRSHLAGLPELPVPTGLQTRLMAIPKTASQPAAPVLGRWLLALGLAIGLLGLASQLQESANPRPLPVPPLGTAAPVASEPVLGPADNSGLDATVAVAGRAPTADGRRAGADALSRPTARPTRPARPGGARSRPASPDTLQGPAEPLSEIAAPPQDPPAHDAGREEPRRAPTAEPTAADPSPVVSSTPRTCIQLSFEAFLDLAGDGGRDCPGCDGRFTDDDAPPHEAHREEGPVTPLGAQAADVVAPAVR